MLPRLLAGTAIIGLAALPSALTAQPAQSDVRIVTPPAAVTPAPTIVTPGTVVTTAPNVIVTTPPPPGAVGHALYSPLDFQKGTWGTQPLTPDPGLGVTDRDVLVGRQVFDSAGQGFGSIRQVLFEPTTNEIKYVVVAGVDLGGGNHVIIPLSALKITDASVTADASSSQMLLLPRYTVADINQRFRQVAYVPAPVGYILRPQSELVGRTVVDASGRPVGTVNYVLVTPNTNEVRYVVVSGPGFRPDEYITVPAPLVRATGDQVIVSTPYETIIASPRYRRPEMEQSSGFRPYGSVY